MNPLRWSHVFMCVAQLVSASCRKSNTEEPITAPSTPSRSDPTPTATPPSSAADAPALPAWRQPSVARVVAIGDLHGDLDATRAAFRAADLLDGQDHWAGGSTVVVQTGDQLDRGTQERELIAFLQRMETEAHAAGGTLHVLNGNHEIMNAEGDFRYVPPAGFADFQGQRARAELFAPGGRHARWFATHNTVLIVGDTAFVHGGLTPSHVEFGVEKLNLAVRDYFWNGAHLPGIMTDESSPVWHRTYALRDDSATCATLHETLQRLNVARLVIGHTVQQQGINSACEQQVWRIDVGLARLYETPAVQALELKPGVAPRILSSPRS